MNFNSNRSALERFCRVCALATAAIHALLGIGCASVSVKDSRHHTRPPADSMPETIFIRPFEAPDAAFRVDRSGAGLDQFKSELQDRMSRNLARRLSAQVAPTVVIANDTPLPRGNFWLVEGRFDHVAQGSRALRAAIGLGLGATKLEVTSVLSDLSGKAPAPLLEVRTTGGSGAMPGAIGAITPFGALALIPIGVAANALTGAHSGIGFDAARTSREVTAAIAHYSWQHGIRKGERPPAPKRKGELPEKLIPFL